MEKKVVVTCAASPGDFGLLGATSKQCEDKVCSPRTARNTRPSSLTQAWLHLFHPQVLGPGRAESGAFRSTPALYMIGAKACSVVRKCCTERCDTHF